MNHEFEAVCILEQDAYKPGDQPPEGYLAWHEWAEVQRKAGIKQAECGKCGLWKTPQELSAEVREFVVKDTHGSRIIRRYAVCNKCASGADLNQVPT